MHQAPLRQPALAAHPGGGWQVVDLAEIEEAAAAIAVQGARYPGHLERLTGR